MFLVELAAIMILAEDRRAWLRRYPLAPAMLILTPPFAPAALQALRVVGCYGCCWSAAALSRPQAGTWEAE